MGTIRNAAYHCGGFEMAEIVAFIPPAARTKRMADTQTKPLGEVVFFTGVRYERWISAAVAKTKPQPSKSARLKSKA